MTGVCGDGQAVGDQTRRLVLLYQAYGHYRDADLHTERQSRRGRGGKEKRKKEETMKKTGNRSGRAESETFVFDTQVWPTLCFFFFIEYVIISTKSLRVSFITSTVLDATDQAEHLLVH